MNINRIEAVRCYMNELFNSMEDKSVSIAGYHHSYSVSSIAGMLAKKRGLDVEIAQLCGLLHDIAYYKTGEREEHAALGSVLAKDVLSRMMLTDDEENKIICNAIFNHSDKYSIQGEYDELLKDSDAFFHVSYNFTLPIKNTDRVRYKNVCEELSLK